MIEFIEQWFLENWRPEFGAPRPQRLSLVKTASSGVGLPAKERESKIFFYVFLANNPWPFAIVKFPRFAHSVASLEREHWTLRALAGDEKLGAAFQKSVPAPLYFGDMGESKAAVQSILSGRILRTAPGRGGRRADALFKTRFQSAANWLGTFRTFAACGATPFSEAHVHQWFLVPIQQFRQAAALVGANVDEPCRVMLEDADTLCGAVFEHVRQHGDFTLSNVSYAAGECRVLDFEHFGLEKNPLFDVFWFTRSLASAVYGDKWFQAGPVADTLNRAAKQALGDCATPQATRALYSQALVQLFMRKFHFRPDNQASVQTLVAQYVAELEAVRALFAA